MNFKILLTFTFLLTNFSLVFSQQTTTKPKDIPVIELKGTPYERGFQLGQSLKNGNCRSLQKMERRNCKRNTPKC